MNKLYNISYSVVGKSTYKGVHINAKSFANMEEIFKSKFPDGEIEGVVIIK